MGPISPWWRAHEALSLTGVSAEGPLSGARFGPVTLEAYQVAPVMRILAKPRPRLLIADDVGFGKTIEAGVCMLELMARRRAGRILTVVPPGLLDQWHDELLEKFGLDFAPIESAAGLARASLGLWTIMSCVHENQRRGSRSGPRDLRFAYDFVRAWYVAVNRRGTENRETQRDTA